MIRIAAVGDVHVGPGESGRLHRELEGVSDDADILLLAGDMSTHGRPEEAEIIRDDLGELDVPIVAVLGNHEYENGAEDKFRELLEEGGIHVLEGSSATFDIGGSRVGVAGTIGFGGGFPGGSCADFGEAEFKAFVGRSRQLASSLQQALHDLDSDVRIALTHYSPVRDTLEGENPEIYPFLGSHFLADAIDLAGAQVAVHGHAHAGRHEGHTPGGVPVRNVARDVIARPYVVLHIEGRQLLGEPTPH